MSYDPILRATAAQVAPGLIALGAVWSFNVTVPGATVGSPAFVAAADPALLSVSTPPTATVTGADTVAVRATVAVAVASGTSKVFNIRVIP